jgi:hypothetical protein
MCMSCGCRQVNDDRGDTRSITADDLHDAARAAGASLETVIRNIAQTYREAGATREEPGIAGQDPRANDREAARREIQERARSERPDTGDESPSEEEDLHEYHPSDYEPDIEKRKQGYGRSGTSGSPH